MCPLDAPDIIILQNIKYAPKVKKEASIRQENGQNTKSQIGLKAIVKLGLLDLSLTSDFPLNVKADLHGAILSHTTSFITRLRHEKSCRILKYVLKPYNNCALKSVVSTRHQEVVCGKIIPCKSRYSHLHWSEYPDRLGQCLCKDDGQGHAECKQKINTSYTLQAISV